MAPRVGARIFSGGQYEDTIGYRRAVVLAPEVGTRVIVSGCTAMVDGSVRHPGDAYGQTHIAIDVIERALTLDFLPEARNLILAGANGLGKTMIAQNICHAAVLAGHSVLFRSAAALLEELHRQTPEGRQRKLRTYANVGLLCVDEVGYLSFDDKSADLLYEVVNRRYERKSVVLTTNRPFKEWNEVFPNAACIVTLLDRLLHHADVTKIEGDSYRVRESEQETAARRRKK